MSLAGRVAAGISLEYSLLDRMRIRGHVLHLQTITMLRTYFQQVHDVDWIEPADLQRLADGNRLLHGTGRRGPRNMVLQDSPQTTEHLVPRIGRLFAP